MINKYNFVHWKKKFQKLTLKDLSLKIMENIEERTFHENKIAIEIRNHKV